MTFLLPNPLNRNRSRLRLPRSSKPVRPQQVLSLFPRHSRRQPDSPTPNLLRHTRLDQK